MRKTHQQLQSELSLDYLIDMVRQKLLQLPDPRNRKVKFSFHDLVMSGFAIFHFKYPSVNRFKTQTVAEKANLQNLFKIENLCSDSHLRNVLDPIDPSPLRVLFSQGIKLLGRIGVLKSYKYFNKYYICSVDGVQYFSSKEVHCENCLTKKHRNGEITYHHNMLCAALVHPDKKEVFIMGAEPILKQDGEKKNDCELNASKRLLPWLKETYKDYPLLMVEDALFANGPNLREIIAIPNWEFIVNIKPDSHKTLFKAFEGRKQNGTVSYKKWTDKDGTLHQCWYANNFALNEANSDIRLNVLMYEQKNKNGQVKKFSWATSIKITWYRVKKIMYAGRSRWKIENETFNTLKNQGYNFDHNFGHGFKYLSIFLSYLMLLAFQIDQIFQRCNEGFKRIWVKAKTKVKLWQIVKAIFSTTIIASFKELYILVAAQFRVQLE